MPTSLSEYSTKLNTELARYGAAHLSVLSPMTHQQYLDLMLGQDPGLSRLRAELAAFDQSFFLWRWWRRLVSMFEPISLLQQRALLSFHETQQLQTQLADLKSCTEESRRTSLINEINALKSQWEINQKAISFWSGLWKALNLMKQCFALPETQSLLQKERAVVAVGLDGKPSIPTAKVVEAEASAVVYDYRVLKLNKGASLEAIKEAYRQASRIYHPDKGGSHELFTELQQEHQRIKAELEERRVGDDKINELEKRIDSMEKTHAEHRAKMQADEAAHREEMMARERAAEERERAAEERERAAWAAHRTEMSTRHDAMVAIAKEMAAILDRVAPLTTPALVATSTSAELGSASPKAASLEGAGAAATEIKTVSPASTGAAEGDAPSPRAGGS